MSRERLMNILRTNEAIKGGLYSFERGPIGVLNRAETALIGGDLRGILRGEV